MSTEELGFEIVADPVHESASLSDKLPGLIEQAEAAGLSIIAQHLCRALALAERVSASGSPAKRPPRARAPSAAAPVHGTEA